jgi:DNA helicase HerA-like ATPase
MSEKWISAGGVVLEKLEKPYRVYVVKPSNDYGPMGEHDFETEEVRLVTFEQAKKLFASMGNSRDITILERAKEFLKNFDKKQNEVYDNVLNSLLEMIK